MSIRTRRILFYLFTFLFLIVGSGLVLYSKGFRFDFKEGQLVQTGGIYLKIKPTDAQIQLNGRPIKNKSGLLQSGTLIDNLLPGFYRLRVSKDNYHSWEKRVMVEPSIVDVFGGIILLPEKGEEKIAEAADAFYQSNNKLIQQKEGAIILAGKKIIGQKVVEVTGDGRLISRDGSGSYYLVSLDDPVHPLNISKLFARLKESQPHLGGAAKIAKIIAYPYNSRKFLILSDKKALYALDSDRNILEQLGQEINDFWVVENELFAVSQESVFSYQLVFRNKNKIPLAQGLTPQDIEIIGVSPSKEWLVLFTKGNRLVLQKRDGGNSRTLSNGATNQFSFSYDSKKLVFVSRNERLYFYDLEKEKLFSLTSFPVTGVKKMIWHKDNGYIFVQDGDNNLDFVEVNEFPPSHRTRVAAGIKTFDYDKNNNLLYFSTSEGIWRLAT